MRPSIEQSDAPQSHLRILAHSSTRTRTSHFFHDYCVTHCRAWRLGRVLRKLALSSTLLIVIATITNLSLRSKREAHCSAGEGDGVQMCVCQADTPCRDIVTTTQSHRILGSVGVRTCSHNLFIDCRFFGSAISTGVQIQHIILSITSSFSPRKSVHTSPHIEFSDVPWHQAEQ